MNQELQDKDVVGLKHLRRLLPLLSQLHEVGCARDKAGNRRLHFDEYCALVVLYLFNPLLDSLRMLQAACGVPKVRQFLGIGRFSLGSFSEAPAVFEPEKLKAVIAELAAEAKASVPLLPPRDPRLSDLKQTLTLVDGTLLRALPKLAESFCRADRGGGGGGAYHAWKLHVQKELDCPLPHRVDRTGAGGGGRGGDCDERRVLERSLEAGRCYVMDRWYYDVGLFERIVAADSSYVCRVREDLSFELVEEKLLAQEALDASVVRDAIVRVGLGRKGGSRTMRLIVVATRPHPKRTRRGTKQSDGLVMILTNLPDLPAELIALIYRYRWSIELFFRFLKQLLGLRHLLSQRPAGVDIQVYCALIACLLIHLATGRKPDKSLMLMLNLYLMGWADEQDVLNHLSRPDNTGVKLRAKDELWKKLGVQ